MGVTSIGDSPRHRFTETDIDTGLVRTRNFDRLTEYHYISYDFMIKHYNIKSIKSQEAYLHVCI